MLNALNIGFWDFNPLFVDEHLAALVLGRVVQVILRSDVALAEEGGVFGR